MEALTAELEDRDLEFGEGSVANDCLKLMEKYSLSAETFASKVESALFSSTVDDDRTISATILAEVTAALAKKPPSRKRAPPAATPNRFTRANIDLLPGFSAPITPTVPTAPAAGSAPPGKRRMVTPPSAAAGAGIADRMPPKVQRVGAPTFSPTGATALNAHLEDKESAEDRIARNLRVKAMAMIGDEADDGTPRRGVVAPLPAHLDRNIRAPFRWMFTSQAQRAVALDDRAAAMEAAFLERVGISADDLGKVGVPMQTPVTVFGRICVDTESDGHINSSSVLLEGSLVAHAGTRIRINIDRVPGCVLFPGQMVAVTGINAIGHTMIAHRITQIIPAPRPGACLPAEVRAMAVEATVPTRVWAASGPFTATDNLKFEELKLFLSQVASASPPPDVVVLMGPFVDEDHVMLRSGSFLVPDSVGEEFPLSFDEIVQLKLSELLGACLGSNAALRLVIVPSVKDTTAPLAFPQPPMRHTLLRELDASARQRITLVSNPAMFTFNGVVFGTTSVDALMDLTAETLKKFPPKIKPDRLAVMSSLLLEQQHFYPLFPPAESVPLDLNLSRHLDMPVRPDVLLLSSLLEPCVKPLPFTVAVNCGKVARFTKAGCYAKLSVMPASAAPAPPPGKEADTDDLVPRIKAEIVQL